MDAVQEEKEASTPQKKGASKLPSLTEEQIKARFEGTIKSVNYRHFIGQSSVILKQNNTTSHRYTILFAIATLSLSKSLENSDLIKQVSTVTQI